MSESVPPGIFGGCASEAVGSLLQRSGASSCIDTSTVPAAVENGSLSVAPSGSVAVDRVVRVAAASGALARRTT